LLAVGWHGVVVMAGVRPRCEHCRRAVVRVLPRNGTLRCGGVKSHDGP
jgi:hypothetical protein